MGTRARRALGRGGRRSCGPRRRTAILAAHGRVRGGLRNCSGRRSCGTCTCAAGAPVFPQPPAREHLRGPWALAVYLPLGAAAPVGGRTRTGSLVARPPVGRGDLGPAPLAAVCPRGAPLVTSGKPRAFPRRPRLSRDRVAVAAAAGTSPQRQRQGLGREVMRPQLRLKRPAGLAVGPTAQVIP